MSKMSDLTLLYVEDDKELREQFMRILNPKFKEIFEASDGLTALEQYQEHKPNMILIDINLPKLDGLEVIERVREHDKETPIVILSAYSDQDKLLRAIKLGLSEYLIKPVPNKKLLSLLNDIATIYESQREDKNTIQLQNSYCWKKDEKILYYQEEVIYLTKRERILLDFMLKYINTIVPSVNILNLLWEYDENQVAYSALSHLLKRLKKKLPEELIENIYGEGYRVSSK